MKKFVARLLFFIVLFSFITGISYAENGFNEGNVDFNYAYLFSMNENDLLVEINSKLITSGYSDIISDDENMYIYAKGQLPVLLVCHIDTVQTIPIVLQDNELNVLWSKTGLGADDRAGISAIFEILDKGYRPYVLFCNKEETGLVGAKVASSEINAPEVNIVVELDSSECGDFKTYFGKNILGNKYIESFGLKFKDSIRASDICAVCPAWNIYGVNLGIGYYLEHTADEYLDLSQWKDAVECTYRILDNPPDYKFDYYSIFDAKEIYKDYLGYLKNNYSLASKSNNLCEMFNAAMAADEYRTLNGKKRLNENLIKSLSKKLKE